MGMGKGHIVTDVTDTEIEPTEKEKARARNARIDALPSRLRGRSIPDGNVVGRYKLVSNRRKIVLALLIAFVIRILATVDTEGAKKGKAKVRESVTGQNLVSWAVLAAFLAIASDIDATSDIAVAFALLILVASLLTSGPDALSNLDKLVKGGKQIQKAAYPKPQAA